MIIHEIIVKEKLKQNSTIAGHYLQSASKPNVSSLVVFGIKKKNEIEKCRIADGFFAEPSNASEEKEKEREKVKKKKIGIETAVSTEFVRRSASSYSIHR